MAQWPSPQYACVCTVITVYCRGRAFKKLLLSKVRQEVQALEFQVTINQNCIAAEIK